MRALIVGGGIGGLSVALALRHTGLDVLVYEQSPELREAGAGLVLWASAMRLLRGLGVADPLREAGAPVHRAQIRSWHGALLSDTDISHVTQKHGEPSVCLHRADLQRVLADALPKECLSLGRVCSGVDQTQNDVAAHFVDGGIERGDLLVAADGLHSVIRNRLVSDRLRYAGYTCWRGIAPIEAAEPAVLVESWGNGRRFGMGPIGRGRTLWWATVNAPEGGSDSSGGRKADVLSCLRNCHPPALRLVEATDETAILRNDIYDRRPIRMWGEGRVTLLGDAAHPATPNLGMGACQAIEDAVVLGTCLRDDVDPAVALRRYEKRRLPRTTRITDLSWRLGQVSQWSSPVACAARDWLVRLTPAAVERRQFEWLTILPETRA